MSLLLLRIIITIPMHSLYTLSEGQTFNPHPHPEGFTKLPECPVTSLAVVLGFIGSGGGVKSLSLITPLSGSGVQWIGVVLYSKLVHNVI